MTEPKVVKFEEALEDDDWGLIIGKDGKIAKTFTSMTNPSSKKFTSSIEELIK